MEIKYPIISVMGLMTTLWAEDWPSFKCIQTFGYKLCILETAFRGLPSDPIKKLLKICWMMISIVILTTILLGVFAF
jgi:hypothetical protein